MNEGTIQQILRILESTREDPRYSTSGTKSEAILNRIEGIEMKSGYWYFTRDARISLAQMAVELGAQVEYVIELLNWKDFEGFVAHILAEHEFRCIESFRRKGNQSTKGMEIDVIGIRGATIISADAKMWGIRRGKSSALKMAAENQKQRSVKLASMMNKVAEKVGHLSLRNYRIYPILVTWLVEEVQFHDGVPIVPVFKFNSFILNLDSFQNLMVSYPYEIVEN